MLGTVGLTVRYGAKAIEFEKGKTAIVVPSKDQLVATLETVISAVRAGELTSTLLNIRKRVEYQSRNSLPERKPQVPGHVELALNPQIEPAT